MTYRRVFLCLFSYYKKNKLVVEPYLMGCSLWCFFFLKRMICDAQSVTLLLSQVIFFASQAQVGQMHCKIITAYPFLTEFKPILEIQKEHKNSHCPYTCSLKLRRYVSSWSCLKISLMIPWILRLGVHISWELGWAWHYERIFSLIYQSTNTRKK